MKKRTRTNETTSAERRTIEEELEEAPFKDEIGLLITGPHLQALPKIQTLDMLPVFFFIYFNS